MTNEEFVDVVMNQAVQQLYWISPQGEYILTDEFSQHTIGTYGLGWISDNYLITNLEFGRTLVRVSVCNLVTNRSYVKKIRKEWLEGTKWS